MLNSTLRALFRTARNANPSLRPSFSQNARFAIRHRSVKQQWQRRSYTSEVGPDRYEGNPLGLIWMGTILAAGGLGYGVFLLKPEWFGQPAKSRRQIGRGFIDYQEVYNAIAERLAEEDNYDDGSYGPVLLRLAWHASGTYDALTGTGGSNGATMRFAPEGDHGANSGLKAARDFLEPVKEAFPWISYSDLWILSAVCAIQEMQGPKIPFRPGRSDRDVAFCTPDGRLPDASKDASHIRAIFGRMGFGDREMVALSGAHALGRCHTDRSGFEGPWTFSPTTLTNDYYKLLLEEKWVNKKWKGPKQFQDVKTKSLMMLPTDMELIKDKSFRIFTEKYAQDNEAFFVDFSDAIVRLFELGVPFMIPPHQRFVFKSSFD